MMNEQKTNRDFDKTVEAFKRYNRFFIGTHVFPDGDNIGSIVAVELILERMKKSSYLYCETRIPTFYEWMRGSENIMHELPDVSVHEFDAIIILDSGDLKRLGKDFREWRKNNHTMIINIDHHKTNEGFGDINWTDDTYAATGEQIYEIAKALGIAIDENLATALYTALYTDTGRFSYSNTNARTLRYASELVEAGAKPNEIYRRVFASRSLAALELEREVLNTLIYDENLKLAYIVMTLDMINRTGANIEDSEGIIEHVALFGEKIKNLLLFKETSPNEIKISVRSKGDWDASLVASFFGGGGHKGAGGYAMKGSMEEVVERSIETIRRESSKGTLKSTDKN